MSIQEVQSHELQCYARYKGFFTLGHIFMIFSASKMKKQQTAASHSLCLHPAAEASVSTKHCTYIEQGDAQWKTLQLLQI